MPTVIYEERPVGYTGPPRRMSTEDRTLWHRFQQQHPFEWTRLLYDVGVGEGTSQQPDVPPEWRTYWLKETQRRIDVLGFLPDKQVIIELRSHALANALGRLIVYRELYLQDPLSPLPLEVWLVTDTTDPELARFFAANGINWITV